METLTLVVGSERVNIVSYRLENVFMGMQGPAGPAVQFGTADQQVLFDDAGVVRGDTGLLFNKTTKTITIGGATVTVSAPVVNATQTWNAAGVTFTGLRLNVTDTASAAGSLLADLQVGGVSKWSVDKTGIATVASKLSTPRVEFPGGALTLGNTGNNFATLGTSAFAVTSSHFVGWSASGDANGGTWDVRLYRDAAGVLAQRNGANAQEDRLYGAFTDLSNYERLTRKYVGTGNTPGFLLTTEAAGTGVARDLVLNGGTGVTHVAGDFHVGRGSTAGAMFLRTLSNNAVSGSGSLSFKSADNVQGAIVSFYTAGHTATLMGAAVAGGLGIVSSGNVGIYASGKDINFGGVSLTAPAWSFKAAGHLYAGADNSYDIGASGASRPRNGYFGTSVAVGLGTGTSGTATLLDNNGGYASLVLTPTATQSGSYLVMQGPGNVLGGALVAGVAQLAIAGDTLLFQNRVASSNFATFASSGLSFLKSTFVHAAGVPLTVDSTNSNSNKLGFQSAGIADSYLGSGAGNLLTVADSAGGVHLTLSATALELKNGATPQGIRGFNSYVDGANGDWWALAPNGNYTELKTVSVGTGVARHLALRTPASTSIYIGPGGGADSWIFQNLGHLLPVAGNTVNLGSASAPVASFWTAGTVTHYGGWTDSANNYGISLGQSGGSSVLTIFNNGTAGGTQTLLLNATNGFVFSSKIQFAAAGHIQPYGLAGNANTMDVGSSGFPWRTGYFGTGIAVGTTAPAYSFHALGGGMRAQALATPAAPTVTPTGVAGATTYTYYVVAKDRFGNKTLASVAGTTATGNAVLDVNNFNALSWAAVAGAASYDVLKTDTGHSIAVGITTTTFNDVGAAPAVYTAPTRNATADLTVDGSATIDGALIRSTGWGFGTSFGIGPGVSITGTGALAVGTNAVATYSGTAIGYSADTSAVQTGTAVGSSAKVTAGTGGSAWGYNAVSSATGAIALGRDALADLANTLCVGGGGSFGITDAYFGSGRISAAPQSFTLHASGGSGTDITGANLTLAGGMPTGAGVGGSIYFATAPAGATGTALRALVNRVQLDQSGNLSLLANTSAFYAYNQNTDANNYTRLAKFWSGGIAIIQTQQAGTGAAASMQIGTTGGGTTLSFHTANVNRWSIDATGMLIPFADGSYTLGNQSTARPLYVYANALTVGPTGHVPLSKVHIALAAGDSSTAPTDYTAALTYFAIGGREFTANSYRLVGFGYCASGANYFPGYMGYQEKNTGGGTFGDLVFLTRNVQTPTVAPSVRWRVTADGALLAEAGNASGYIRPAALTVATLPATSGNGGARATVTDSSVAAAGNFGSVVAGGGANTVPVFCDGVNWIIA